MCTVQTELHSFLVLLNRLKQSVSNATSIAAPLIEYIEKWLSQTVCILKKPEYVSSVSEQGYASPYYFMFIY